MAIAKAIHFFFILTFAERRRLARGGLARDVPLQSP